MAALAAFPGIEPGWSPALIPSALEEGGAGGSTGGIVQNAPSGLSVAIGDGASTEVPLWQNIALADGELGGTGIILSSYEISRGRNYELDKNSPGTASLTLIDLNGTIDPLGGGGYFEIGTPVTIALHNPVTGGDSPIFTGYVTRWGPYDVYPTEDYAICQVELVDGMDRLANMEMHPGEGFTLEWGDFAADSGAQEGDLWFLADDQVEDRINQVLNQAQWPSGQREIFSGNVSLQPTVYAYRTPALTAIQDAADAEFPGVANVYVQKDGKFTFHGRQARFRPEVAQYHIHIWDAGDLAAGGAVISEIAYDKDVEQVINVAIATPKDIADADIEGQRVEDNASISAYGPRAVSFDNLITNEDHFDDSEAKDAVKKFATYYVDNYAEPRVRISKLVFKRLPAGASGAAATWALMCGVDISDIIRITLSSVGGSFSAEDYFVEGLHYSASADDGSGEMTGVTLELDVSPRAYYDTDPWA